MHSAKPIRRNHQDNLPHVKDPNNWLHYPFYLSGVFQPLGIVPLMICNGLIKDTISSYSFVRLHPKENLKTRDFRGQNTTYIIQSPRLTRELEEIDS